MILATLAHHPMLALAIALAMLAILVAGFIADLVIDRKTEAARKAQYDAWPACPRARDAIRAARRATR